MTLEASSTEMTFGNLHVTVHRKFSRTSTENAVDKARKLILQHVFDPEFVENMPEKELAILSELSEYTMTKGGASLEETNGTSG